MFLHVCVLRVIFVDWLVQSRCLRLLYLYFNWKKWRNEHAMSQLNYSSPHPERHSLVKSYCSIVYCRWKCYGAMTKPQTQAKQYFAKGKSLPNYVSVTIMRPCQLYAVRYSKSDSNNLINLRGNSLKFYSLEPVTFDTTCFLWYQEALPLVESIPTVILRNCLFVKQDK